MAGMVLTLTAALASEPVDLDAYSQAWFLIRRACELGDDRSCKLLHGQIGPPACPTAWLELGTPGVVWIGGQETKGSDAALLELLEKDETCASEQVALATWGDIPVERWSRAAQALVDDGALVVPVPWYEPSDDWAGGSPPSLTCESAAACLALVPQDMALLLDERDASRDEVLGDPQQLVSELDLARRETHTTLVVGAVSTPLTSSAFLVPMGERHVASVVGARKDALRACYRAALDHEPELAGTIEVSFVVGPDGHVTRATLHESTMGRPQVEACLLEEFRSLQFARPIGQDTHSVVYPLIFTP